MATFRASAFIEQINKSVQFFAVVFQYKVAAGAAPPTFLFPSVNFFLHSRKTVLLLHFVSLSLSRFKFEQHLKIIYLFAPVFFSQEDTKHTHTHFQHSILSWQFGQLFFMTWAFLFKQHIYLHFLSHKLVRPSSSLAKEESLACQITTKR